DAEKRRVRDALRAHGNHPRWYVLRYEGMPENGRPDTGGFLARGRPRVPVREPAQQLAQLGRLEHLEVDIQAAQVAGQVVQRLAARLQQALLLVDRRDQPRCRRHLLGDRLGRPVESNFRGETPGPRTHATQHVRHRVSLGWLARAEAWAI